VLGTLANVSRLAWKVWRRDLEVYLKTWKTNFLPPLLEPILWILGFGLGLGAFVGEVEYAGRRVSYLAFMAPGVVAAAVMMWAYFETTYSSYIRMYFQRTFAAILATPLLVEDVIAGEWAWGATKSLIAAGIMMGVLAAFGLVEWPSGLLVLPLAVLGGCLFSALGLITTALVPSIEAFNLPIFVLITPMFVFSGTFFPLDGLPSWARAAAHALPLTHVAILVRGATLGWLPTGWALSVLYLLLGAGVSFVGALVLMKRRLVA